VNPQIESAKSEFERICGRLLKNLATTPDDKLNWSPAPSARTPLEIAFHCAKSIALLHGCIDGRDTMPSLTSEQFDAHFREQERNLGSREDVVKMIHENSAAYITRKSSLEHGIRRSAKCQSRLRSHFRAFTRQAMFPSSSTSRRSTETVSGISAGHGPALHGKSSQIFFWLDLPCMPNSRRSKTRAASTLCCEKPRMQIVVSTPHSCDGLEAIAANALHI